MAQAPAAPAKKKSGVLNMVVFLVVAVGAAAGGYFASPYLVGATAKKSGQTDEGKANKEVSTAIIPFGELVVTNLADQRLQRYLRIRFTLVVDGDHEKLVTDLLQKKKSFLKNWLNGYLSSQTTEGVGGAGGMNRIRREIRDEFNRMLFPDGSEKISDILFDEFNIQ